MRRGGGRGDSLWYIAKASRFNRPILRACLPKQRSYVFQDAPAPLALHARCRTFRLHAAARCSFISAVERRRTGYPVTADLLGSEHGA